MTVNMIALIAGSSIQSMVLEKTFSQNGQSIRRFADFLSASNDPEVDVILIEDILVHSELPQTDAVIIGLDARAHKVHYYDATLNYPVKWEQFLEALDAQTPSIFDPHTRDEIEALLGAETYRDSLRELISEIDEAVAAVDQQVMDQKIATVHKISGVSAMLGVRQLHHELLSAEMKGKAGDIDGFEGGWRQFVATWPENRDQILAYIEG